MVAVAAKEKLSGIQPVNQSCGVCHQQGEVKAGASAKPCYDCHKEDMRLAEIPPQEMINPAQASGYQSAMHNTCLKCHRQKAENPEQAHLSECGTCHQSLRPRKALVAQKEPEAYTKVSALPLRSFAGP
jgi:hypothetical protein